MSESRQVSTSETTGRQWSFLLQREDKGREYEKRTADQKE